MAIAEHRSFVYDALNALTSSLPRGGTELVYKRQLRASTGCNFVHKLLADRADDGVPAVSKKVVKNRIMKIVRLEVASSDLAGNAGNDEMFPIYLLHNIVDCLLNEVLSNADIDFISEQLVNGANNQIAKKTTEATSNAKC